MSEVCVLDDGRRVRFSLKRRRRDPFCLVVFRGPDGLRKERSTGERNRRRAKDSAALIIREGYAPQQPTGNPSWDEAIASMRERMEADNLRPKTIGQYL